MKASTIVSSLKSLLDTNNENLSSNSGYFTFAFLIGNNLTSVLDGDISEIHNLSSSESDPTLLLINVTCVLKIPLSYPASLNNLSASIKYSFGNWNFWRTVPSAIKI